MGKKVYDNRELSWLKFNSRVLEEAQDSSVPLMERLKFASIYENNLHEFFMVRVGTLIDRSLENDSQKDGKTKMRPSQQLDAIYKRVRELNETKEKTLTAISKELELKKIYCKSTKNLTPSELEFIDAYYAFEIKPFLNVLVIDSRHPFPFLADGEIYVATRLSSKSDVRLGLISCGGKHKRIVFLPSVEENCLEYVTVEDIILRFADRAFGNYKVEEKALIRITRSADIDVDEGFDIELDFRQNMSALISKRKRLRPVRLQISKNVSPLMQNELLSRLELSAEQCFIEKSPLDLSYVFLLASKLEQRKELFYPKAEPRQSRMVSNELPMFNQIDKGDILLSYPYESIKPFLRFLDEASADPDVASIKMTLYRVARNSRVIKALCDASENGKDVVVLVELRARFDEENNIGWSKELEKAGCRVIYGPRGLKVHSKLCLVTKKANEGIKYYTQIGTGNYNEKTAELYTDLCLMTANRDIALDAAEIFDALSTGKLVESTRSLLVAPHCLQNKVLDMMDAEIAIARSGGEGYVGAKLNSLTDKTIIDKIIECSRAGVKVDLVIRGISCLVAGVEGYTDNVRIISIVGRYLEHSRIYIFGKGERCCVYISSADFMTRNTRRRVEVASPIYDEAIKQRVLDYFNTQLSDNVKARRQCSDKIYRRVANGEIPLDSQKYFSAEAKENAPKPVEPTVISTAVIQTEAETETESKKGIFSRLFSGLRKLFGKKSKSK